MKVKKAKPLFREELKFSPAAPMGSRVLVRPSPIADATEGGIVVPDEAKVRQMSGVLVAVGCDAADKLYDRGAELGDEIWYGKYAGIIEEWQSLQKPGNDPRCKHDGAWDRVPRFTTSQITDEKQKIDPRWDGIPMGEDSTLSECRSCKALRLSERVVVMDAEDVTTSVDLQVRMETGRVKRYRGVTPEGRTRHYLVGVRDTFSRGPEPEAEAAEDVLNAAREVEVVKNGRRAKEVA